MPAGTLGPIPDRHDPDRHDDVTDTPLQATYPPSIERLLEIMRRLRDPESGCPWDVEQDFSSIAPYTIEEAYEVADAIQRNELEELKDELGDLLFQVVFHAQMAEEQGAFAFADVVAAICEKMERRHPHVFGTFSGIDNADAQTEAWQQYKNRERRQKGAESLMDGVPRGMAELQRALKLQKRAAEVGFDWTEAAPILEKIEEELDELRVEIADDAAAGKHQRLEDELGDLLFACVNLGRRLKVNPGQALRRASQKFERRFRDMEQLAGGQDRMPDMSLEQMEDLWQQVKRTETTS